MVGDAEPRSLRLESEDAVNLTFSTADAPHDKPEGGARGGATVLLDGSPLTVEQVTAVARGGALVSVAPHTVDALAASRLVLERVLADGKAHYGINTGFGSLARQRISDGELRQLQRNLVRSHAAAVGERLSASVVRAMMLILAASLARGLSGVRPAVPQLVVEMLNRGIVPVVPSLGSVGASGDLAPLAHVSLVLIGEGEADLRGRRLGGREALAVAGLIPLELEAKEGLALVNGTHLMAAQAALLCADCEALLAAAVAACAMTIDAAGAPVDFLDERASRARNQPGPFEVARLLRSLLAGSDVATVGHSAAWLQAPYSIRCAPAVLGAAREAIDYVGRSVAAELGAVTDNPLVFPDDSIIAAGNFHGMPIALPLDVLAIALAHVAGISERRSFLLLDPREASSKLRPQLSPTAGLCSGYMVAQYTAAACCNELVGLAAPASVVNLPTSAGVEDYNSFGPRSASKAERALTLARYVVAVELMCAAQGFEFQRPARAGAGVERALSIVRAVVPPLADDRVLAPDIEMLARRISAGDFVGLETA